MIKLFGNDGSALTYVYDKAVWHIKIKLKTYETSGERIHLFVARCMGLKS